jgi:acyl dehydratase
VREPEDFDDIHPGRTAEFGSFRVEESDIVAFARQFDPQAFHLDREAAKESLFGGLAASGWHTAAMMMRMLVDHALSPETSLGSPGVDELRWLRPVRPGDVLSLRTTVLETTRSRSKPDRGVIRSFVEVINQDRDVVMTVKTMVMVRCRPAAAG